MVILLMTMFNRIKIDHRYFYLYINKQNRIAAGWRESGGDAVAGVMPLYWEIM